MSNWIVQTALIIFSGIAAAMLTSHSRKRRLIGSIAGLMGQPFWFYTAITNDQWGIVVLAGWYAFSYCKGIYNNYFRTPDAIGVRVVEEGTL